ncbi:MAG: hypothetical protein JWO36_1144 [Myxococcales bacterium]|nr:hypothetical protein [Myxococcales bacterium]
MTSIRFIAAALAIAATASCGPGRTAFARYPGATPAFDRNASDPKAVAIADAVVAAAGGQERWAAAKQVRWSETIAHEGKPAFDGEEAWDRWQGRHHGRLHRDEGDMIVMRALYDDDSNVFIERSGQLVKLPPEEARHALPAAAERWQFDTAALCMQFLLEEPGTKLEYVGEPADDATLEDIKVSFDPKDTNRGGVTYQISVHKDSHVIERLMILKAGGNIGYKLSQWVDVGGLKFPTLENNLGYAGEVITFKNITTGSPDELLYSPPIH